MHGTLVGTLCTESEQLLSESENVTFSHRVDLGHWAAKVAHWAQPDPLEMA